MTTIGFLIMLKYVFSASLSYLTPIVFCRKVVMPDINMVVLRSLALKFSFDLAHRTSATRRVVDKLLERDINTC